MTQEEKLARLKQMMAKIEVDFGKGSIIQHEDLEKRRRIAQKRHDYRHIYLPAPVREFEVDGIMYGTPGNNTCYVVRGGNHIELNIPANVMFDGTCYDVIAVYFCAFIHCYTLEKVILPEGIQTIGSNALEGCDNLKEVVLPESLTTIGYKAFSLCSNLSSINLPASLEYIGMYAFQHCRSLTDIAVPDGVTIIDKGAFRGCNGLVNVILPESIEAIEEEAFRGCSNLTNINISDNITVIGCFAFSVCESLDPMKIPEKFRNAMIS